VSLPVSPREGSTSVWMREGDIGVQSQSGERLDGLGIDISLGLGLEREQVYRIDVCVDLMSP